MKTLGQWLEDSSTSSSEDAEQRQLGTSSGGGAAPSVSDDRRSSVSQAVDGMAVSMTGSPVVAHTPTTLRPMSGLPGEIRGRQEETREKMFRLLGAEAVIKATTPTLSNTTADSPAWPVASPPNRTHFPFGATPLSQPAASPKLWKPSGSEGGEAGELDTRKSAVHDKDVLRSGIPAGADVATDSSQLPYMERTMPGFGRNAVYEPVEVEVVDRGTQTTSTEGTQTDPLPMPYGAYYFGPYAPSPYTGAGAYGECIPMTRAMAIPPRSLGVGVDGRPYRHCTNDFEEAEAAEGAKLRGELEMIQSSIDMLIARYNLPPPPM